MEVTNLSRQEFSKVTIRSTARLHLGFIDLHGGLGRIYGSLGVALNQPEYVVELKRKDQGLDVSGEQQVRVRTITEQLMAAWAYSAGLQVTTLKAIPEHVGLGSGTQLSLAIGTGIAMLCGLHKEPREVATILGRGAVSGIGTATFTDGGFVIDGGKPIPTANKSDGKIPPLLVRYDVPGDWVFVVAIPQVTKGLSGAREEQAFRGLPSAKPEQAQLSSRLILMKLLPALVQDRIEEFSEALTAIQILVGDAFASAQGGRFASPEVADCVHTMIDAGSFGAGQSSWGPACYGLVRGLKSAALVKKAVTKVMDAATGGTAFIARANNAGAHITTD